ncbi:MAG: UvrB/UvrC motif-containing protein [Clostridia bacterium]|nr:UvrB/UvrC motif-containing protein [Clostridia bacterium]
MKHILCEHCGEKAANFFYEENRNGKITKVSLCSDCAKKAGFGKNLFSEEDLFGAFSLFPSVSERKVTEETCPVCKKSLGEIRKSGKFGCSACYDRFAGRLDLTPFLGKEFHGFPLTEKTDPNVEQSKEDSVRSLKKELEKALQAEEYEKAAKLRDKIRSLEGK